MTDQVAVLQERMNAARAVYEAQRILSDAAFTEYDRSKSSASCSLRVALSNHMYAQSVARSTALDHYLFARRAYTQAAMVVPTGEEAK